MDKIKTVAEGWYNLMRSELNLLPENLKQMAEKRTLICSTCVHRQDSRCGACGCPLAAKTKSRDANCPKGFWNSHK